MENKKVTKKEYYSALIDALNGTPSFDERITQEDTINFIHKEIQLLDNKAEAAQKRAAQKKEAGDELRERIYEVLDTENYMNINEVVEALNDPEISMQMVSPRIAQLVTLNRVEKDSISIKASDGGRARKRAVYKKI